MSLLSALDSCATFETENESDFSPCDGLIPSCSDSADAAYGAEKHELRALTATSVRGQRLSKHDPHAILRVLTSHPSFDPAALWGFSEFRRLSFQHPFFVGTGEGLLRYLGLEVSVRNYAMLAAQVLDRELPEDLKHPSQTRAWHSAEAFGTSMADETMALFGGKSGERRPWISESHVEQALYGWRALGGVIDDQVLPDDDPARESRIVSNLFALRIEGILSPLEQKIIERHFGYRGEPQSLKKIGQNLGEGSPERIRQKEAEALGKLRKFYLRVFQPCLVPFAARRRDWYRFHEYETVPLPTLLIPVLPRYSRTVGAVVSYVAADKKAQGLVRFGRVTPTPARLLDPRTFEVVGYIGMEDGER